MRTTTTSWSSTTRSDRSCRSTSSSGPSSPSPAGRRTRPTPSSRAPTRWSSSTATGHRDPRPIPLPARPDAPGLPHGHPRPGLRGRRGRGRPGGHRRLQPGPALRARAPGSWPSRATRSTSRSRPGSTWCSPTGCSRCGPSRRPRTPSGRTRSRARGCYVVGGTNGIGRAIAEEARRQGAQVEVDGRSMGLDVRDYAAVASHVDAAAARMGGLDHVVVHGRRPAHRAGRWRPNRPTSPRSSTST